MKTKLELAAMVVICHEGARDAHQRGDIQTFDRCMSAAEALKWAAGMPSSLDGSAKVGLKAAKTIVRMEESFRMN
mgnify:CR=1 FL=1|tara:strand:- start:265 stop:489 length:225 start_codon:yes stop_codon:yes gene_type:complete